MFFFIAYLHGEEYKWILTSCCGSSRDLQRKSVWSSVGDFAVFSFMGFFLFLCSFCLWWPHMSKVCIIVQKLSLFLDDITTGKYCFPVGNREPCCFEVKLRKSWTKFKLMPHPLMTRRVISWLISIIFNLLYVRGN